MINNFKIKDIRKEITGFKNKSICKKQMYPTYKHMYMEEPILSSADFILLWLIYCLFCS